MTRSFGNSRVPNPAATGRSGSARQLRLCTNQPCNAWPRRRTDKSGRHDEKCGGAPQQQGSQSAGSLLLALAAGGSGRSGRGASPEPGIEDEDQQKRPTGRRWLYWLLQSCGGSNRSRSGRGGPALVSRSWRPVAPRQIRIGTYARCN